MSKQQKITALEQCIADHKSELADAIAAYGATSPWCEAIRVTMRQAEAQLMVLKGWR